MSLQELAEPLIILTELAGKHDARGIKKLLAEMMPTYTPKETGSIL
jgi:hypothetical protein